MATITPKILKKNRKQDGTWNVLFRLSHNRKTRYIKTSHFITQKLIVGEDDVNIDFIIDNLAIRLKSFRKKIDEIEDIESLDVDDVLDILTMDKKDVNFIQFIKEHVEKLKGEGRGKTAKPFVTVLNTLIDFNGNTLMCSKVTSKFLEKHEQLLRQPRIITRHHGDNTFSKSTVVNDKGLNNHMAAFRTLFNEARRKFNDEDTGLILIKNNPFANYKIAPKKRKKHKNISVDMIRVLRDYNTTTLRESIARNMFMLSFYMCGMNAVDIFSNWTRLKKLPNRIGYNRSKTKGKREDDAFISVNIPDLAKEIIKNTEIRYSDIDYLNNAISIGLRSINNNIGLQELTMLHARHSFATIARNDLNISKEDVAIALNHVSEDTRITDVYIAPDWTKIDRVQEKVINKLSEE